MGFSRKKNCNSPVEDINGKFQGVEKKSLEFQGGKPKIEGKHGFNLINLNDWKILGGHGKFDWKSREVNRGRHSFFLEIRNLEFVLFGKQILVC